MTTIDHHTIADSRSSYVGPRLLNGFYTVAWGHTPYLEAMYVTLAITEYILHLTLQMWYRQQQKLSYSSLVKKSESKLCYNSKEAHSQQQW
jgi:hypothetical protein